MLNQVTVPVISDAVCSKPGWYYNDFIPQKTFCAGYEEGQKDACAVRHYTCRLRDTVLSLQGCRGHANVFEV